jgi:recombination protein RecT
MASANGNNAALATKIQSGKLSKTEFKAVVDGFKAEIATALPMHLKGNAEKYARQALTLFSQNPKLQACRPVTILSALMTASALGLDLTPSLGQAYIIPYDNRKKDGDKWVTVSEAQFQLGYRGAIALAQRSDRIARIAADVVRERDFFDYSKGLHPKLEHVESTEEDRGDITHVYAVANFTNGGYAFEVWPVAKVTAHAKKFSKSYDSPKSPWKTDFEAMAKKTLVMAIWKFLPVSTEIMTAVTQDETIKDDVSGISREQDVIDIMPVQHEEEPDDNETAIRLPAENAGLFPESDVNGSAN